MQSGVKIISKQWTQHLPTRDGYDREVVFDHLREAVNRHGAAELVSQGKTFFFAPAAEKQTQCNRCHAPLRRVAGNDGGEVLCISCTWEGPAPH